MRSVALRENDEFQLHGKKYTVISIEHPNAVIQPMTGDLIAEEVNYYNLITNKGFQFNRKIVSQTDNKILSKAQFLGFIDSLPKDKREKIERKYEIIKPLLLLDKVKNKDPKAISLFMDRYYQTYLSEDNLSLDKLTQKGLVYRIHKKYGVSTRTIERDLSNYRKEERQYNSGKAGLISEKVKYPHNRKDSRLVTICHPKKKDMVLCTFRTYLSDDYCKILKEVIEKEYLTKKQARISEIVEIVEVKCHRQKLPVLGYDTVYAIIKRLPEEVVLRLRNGTEAAQIYDPIIGSFSNNEAMSSLHIVEIDHTELDIKLLDENTMEVLGNPWITLGIDVFSRCVWCMHISFDPPSGDKVRKAIEQGVLKKRVKEKYGTTHEWEVYGIPDIIYFDNGKEFDNNQIKHLIDETLGSQVMFRPVANPRWGGTIERLFGTINTKLIHRLAGTTLGSVEAKGEYQSEKEAIYTLADVTELLTRYITDIYHHQTHSSLPFEFSTPYEQYQRGLDMGGQNDFIDDEDEEVFHIELLPAKELSFKRQGIRLDNVYYNDIQSKRFIRNDGSKYKIKYDIDDISYIYLLEPDTREYKKILAVNPSYKNLVGMKRKTYKLLRAIIRKKTKLSGNIPAESDLLDAKDVLLQRAEQMKKTNKGKIRALNLGLEEMKKKQRVGKSVAFTLDEDEELLLLVDSLNQNVNKQMEEGES
ncbi:Mu transposase C-terminal domain-containing protein [Paenibacillus sp. B01]|uniref:Mu transposase C-terminal domain-containing protein n=1 Tax=Paenibacillus sp. B01 TaxID=2660554 RepID=UPI00129A6E86|nr:Mu transposase C-terminal domain-containing protein [Paenibacillus sp. B01]QGG55058.1 DDE-type integrase/transposase/recombinase [Paenibacillus sp. B01]